MFLFILIPNVLVTFSVYSLLMFGVLCKPDEDDDDKETWNWNCEIKCQEKQVTQKIWKKKFWPKNTDLHELRDIYEENVLVDNSHRYNIAQITWVLLVLITCAFLIRELIECVSLRKKFFTKSESYKHIIIDILLIFCLLKGLPVEELKLQRWQYHVATITNFGLWFQMLILAGKYPGYGKYIHMFK